VTKIKKTQSVFYIYGLRFAAERRRLQQLSINSCGRRAACTGAQQQMRVASSVSVSDERGSTQICSVSFAMFYYFDSFDFWNSRKLYFEP